MFSCLESRTDCVSDTAAAAGKEIGCAEKERRREKERQIKIAEINYMERDGLLSKDGHSAEQNRLLSNDATVVTNKDRRQTDNTTAVRRKR